MDIFENIWKNFGINNPFGSFEGEVPFEGNFGEDALKDKIAFIDQLNKIPLINQLEKILGANTSEKIAGILDKGFLLFPHDEEVLKKSIKAALSIERKDLAYKFSRNLPPSTARAIIEYENGDFSGAIFSFSNAKEIPPKMKILYSLSYYKFMEKNGLSQNLEVHSKILDLRTNYSDMAYSIFGVINFNNEDYKRSEFYFQKAKELNKSEINYLNLFKARYVLNKFNEIYSEMNQFFIDTNSKLTSDDLEREFRDKKVKIPKVKIKNLNSVISKFL